MYPPVIWFGGQRWQISLKSAQVDYPLISKAHALRVSHNCRLWFTGTGVPSLPTVRRTDPLRLYNAIHVCLLKVMLTSAFPMCASSHCVLSD